MTTMMRRLSLVGAAVTGVAGCGEPPPGDTYFDHYIQPVLLQNCANNVSGCHRIDPDNPFGRAAGNLGSCHLERWGEPEGRHSDRDSLTSPNEVPSTARNTSLSIPTSESFGSET
jgi:hypothetical protein